ncbi:MAG: sugar ABC transporter permease [Anaerolineales bacterium]
MAEATQSKFSIKTILGWFTTTIGQILVVFIVPVITGIVMIRGFIFLRDGDAPKYVITLVAIIWGVGGVALIYYITNWLIEKLPSKWMNRLQPFLFVGPAVAILSWYMAIPTVRTFILSLKDRTGETFVGFENYIAVFSQRIMTVALRNNLLWILFGATLSVLFGLLVAVLADRSRFEKFAKSMIFLPMAISFVGAGVIWNFIYEVKEAGSAQIGLLNAVWVGLGGQPQAWTAMLQPWNNLFLIIIVIWLQTGYAMVIFSAAIKGIPGELLEAARVDGATEIQVFFRIMIPYIMGTIITVSTTVVIFTLKIFDVVMVMTGGQFATHVIATQFYRQAFTYQNKGYASAIAIVLVICVIPVMIYNLRQFADEEAF